MRGWSKTAWAGAILVSLLVHGAAAVLLATRDDDIQVAGGNPVDIAILGNSFEDAVSAGEIAKASPVEPTEAVDPADADAPAAQSVAAQPAENVPPVQTTAGPAEAPSADVAPAEATVALPAGERLEAEESQRPAEPEMAQPAETVEPSSPEATAALAPEETVNPVADAPIPMPRPDIEALKAEDARREAEGRERARKEQVARQREAPRREQPRQAAGAGGASDADARRGDAAGTSDGRSAQSRGQGAQASAAGSAAVSNYPGQVVTRLRRSLSYPAQARRHRMTGEVHVAFTISAGGAVSAVRVVRSSGHAILDKAAVQTVHRAGPFPPIPAQAGRATWEFTVPLAFSH